MNSSSKTTYAILCAILVIASVLRLIHPFDIPYTGDEFNALQRTHYNSFSELIANGVIVDAHPAGIQVFLYYWTKLFGYSEFAVKLPFIICGILSVLYIFYIGRDWFNDTVGLVCAAFIATLQYTVMYSQIARPYASGLFFALAMVYYWNKVIFKPEEKPYRNAALYILFSALCAYNHYFSLLFAIIVGLTGLFFIKKIYIWRYIAAGLIIFVLFIPHLHIFFYQFGIGGIDKQLARPENNFILEYLKYVFHFSLYVCACIVALLLLGIANKMRNKPPRSPYLAISICWFLLPFLISFFYSRYVHSVLQYSALIFSFPFLLFSLFGYLPQLQGKLKALLIFSICLLITISLIYEREYYSIFYTSRYEQIVLMSDSESKKLRPDSCLTLIQSSAELPEDYYIRKDKVDTSSFIFMNDSAKKQKLINLIEQEKKPYLSFGSLGSPDPNDVAIFLNYYPYLIKRSDFYGGTFYLFSSKPDKGKSPITFKSTNDFEQPQEFWSASDPKFVSDSIFYSGKHSYKFDSLHEWGPAYMCSLNKMITSNRSVINISVELLPLEPLTDVFIVSSLESKGKTIDWRSTPVNNFLDSNKNKKWQKAYHSLEIPNMYLNYPDITVKIYFWNKGKKNFYIADFNISTVSGNPIIYGIFEKI